jgi:hypothetical protein
MARIWSAVSFPVRWVLQWLRPQEPHLFRIVRVADVPDSPQKLKIYVVGEGDNAWALVFICPCGCGETIELNLLKQARPCWSVLEHSDGTVTLAPSIWRQKGCRSHFFVRNGVIEWC